ncbi:hypothetical protein P2G88_09630 [Aliiglaciecola sp. CAU 1673]|uniref:hypothetical protein n=1 Tax=Aliiglaciecola sp. CAU 1673 TaxID=3032595 RepID=UPI0023DC194A|nr:hypothetical protein [Aliiglaciecola sp. CAU 1673]MDF2178513.1 hypothetical protein [Aliiglaciecola sp. CAU 1673]
MSVTLKKADKYGSFELSQEGPLIIATFKGILGGGLSKHYKQAILSLAQSYNKQPWAYIADGMEHDVSIPAAAENLRQVYLECLKLGCVGDAYCMPSAVGLSQLEKVRKSCGFVGSIYDRSYADVESAKQAMLNTVAELSHT